MPTVKIHLYHHWSIVVLNYFRDNSLSYKWWSIIITRPQLSIAYDNNSFTNCITTVSPIGYVLCILSMLERRRMMTRDVDEYCTVQ